VLVRGLLSPDEVDHFCQLTPEDMLELACEPDAVSRLIRESGGSAPWVVLHGPLDLDKVQELAQPDSGTISELGSSDLDRSLWTVLVNQVDRVLPEVEELRDAVADFVPRWRVDDVMVSYARTGCSIGAHADNYDVILLQGRGSHTWSFELDGRSTNDEKLIEGASVRVLTRFAPDVTVILQPGDALYLPPRLAHHGVSKSDDCMTYSIGFRAPTSPELFRAFGKILAERAPADAVFAPTEATRDIGSTIGGKIPLDDEKAEDQLDQGTPSDASSALIGLGIVKGDPLESRGRIAASTLVEARQILVDAVDAFLADEAAVAEWLGCALTAPRRQPAQTNMLTGIASPVASDVVASMASVSAGLGAPSLAQEIANGEVGDVFLRHTEGAVLTYVDVPSDGYDPGASAPREAAGSTLFVSTPLRRQLFLDGELVDVAADALTYLPLICDTRVIPAGTLRDGLVESQGLRTLVDELLRRDAIYADVDMGSLD